MVSNNPCIVSLYVKALFNKNSSISDQNEREKPYYAAGDKIQQQQLDEIEKKKTLHYT